MSKSYSTLNWVNWPGNEELHWKNKSWSKKPIKTCSMVDYRRIGKKVRSTGLFIMIFYIAPKMCLGCVECSWHWSDLAGKCNGHYGVTYPLALSSFYMNPRLGSENNLIYLARFHLNISITASSHTITCIVWLSPFIILLGQKQSWGRKQTRNKTDGWK